MLSEIFSSENRFLIAAVLIWIAVAVIMDFRKREVANWWNFSFVIVALAYRAFLSVFEGNYIYFMSGVVGLAAGFILANAFYYARIFAGGDAKLMLGLSTVLPLSLSFSINLEIFALFLVLFLIAGSVYGAIFSIILAFVNRKKFMKEFGLQFKNYGKIAFYIMALAVVFGISTLAVKSLLGICLSVLLFVVPLLLIFAKAVEECCMVKLVSTKELAIGDWLAKFINVNGKKINPTWQGLSEQELAFIQRGYKRKVFIKHGIPFTPAFLLAFAGMLILLWFDLIPVFLF